jgi:sarcosine oxidase gamma subunit
VPSNYGDKVERLMGPDKSIRESATWWFVSGTATHSRAAVKIATLKARLTGRDQSAVSIIVSAEGKHAHNALAAFVRAMGSPQPRVAKMLAQAKGD